jgi:uncharacterized phage protein (TIGR01671 family)
MKDRFRFRIWDKKSEDWVESMSMCNFGFLTMQNGTDIEEDGFNEDDLLVEQCTGLKDKNGRLIYEGDIVRTHLKRIGKVFWNEMCWCYRTLDNVGCTYIMETYDVEVIGNIHENPELLEE